MQPNDQEGQVYEILKRREKKSMQGSLLFILICLGLGLTTIYFGYKSEKQKEEIETASFIQDSLIRELEAQSISSERTKLEYIKKLDSFKLAFNRIDSLLKLSAATTPIQKEIKKEIEDIKKPDGPKYTIYLHAYGGRAKDAIKEFNIQLRKNGFIAKGIEEIKTPFTSRVTYFNEDDATLANRITKLLHSSIEDKSIASLSPVYSKMRAPKGQVEVWLNLEPKIDKEQYIKDQIIKDVYFKGQELRQPK